jgi:capsular polysaccharide biosynthesis protein
MELRHYFAIVRRRWQIVAAVPLLVGLLSLAVALTRPPVYGLGVRLLVTRGPLAGEFAAGVTATGEDKTAQDLPAIISGAPFAEDVARALASQGRTGDPSAVRRTLSASNDHHVVYLSVAADDPAEAVAIADAAIAVLKANGMRYWGSTQATAEQPGLDIAVLDPPASAARINGTRAIALEVALRTLLGLITGVGIVFGLHYLDHRRPTTDDRRPTTTVNG